MPDKAKYWIDKLALVPHPEGGHFKEIYRSNEVISNQCLPDRYNSSRSISTSIYFLLQKNEISAFHRLRSDETWYFHDGATLEIIVLDEAGRLSRKLLGLDISLGEMPQFTILKNQWFAAQSLGEFTLVGCNVAPGFHFNDFELANYSVLVNQYPNHKALLKKFCLLYLV